MKKYVKPELFYERYELSQHIADCAWEWVYLVDEQVCYATPDKEKIPFDFDFGGFEYRLFAADPICTLLSSGYTDYCYQNGAANANLYKS